MKKLLCILSFILMSASIAAADVAINSENFPDNRFRNYVNSTYNTNRNAILEDSEIRNVTKIDVKGYGIEQLKGIEFFTYLSELDCSNNKLTELDLSSNTSIVSSTATPIS